MAYKSAAFTQHDVSVLACDTLYDGFFKLNKLTLTHPLFNGGTSGEVQREVVVRGEAVGVLLYDPRTQQFGMVEQVRVGVLGREQSPWLLELVAGLMDKEGESAAEVAHRETLEEAGLTIEAIEPVIGYFCSPGGSTEYLTVLCAKVDLSDVQNGVFGLVEESEDIRRHVLPVDDVIALLNQGVLNNAMTIIALQWWQLHRARLDALWL